MSTKLYEASSWQDEPGNISCLISYNPDSPVFKGHFPGNPIVPGVCTLEMIMDLLQRSLGKKLTLRSASNVKFLQLITPSTRPSAQISWNKADTGYSVNAILKDGETVLFKMSASYAELE